MIVLMLVLLTILNNKIYVNTIYFLQPVLAAKLLLQIRLLVLQRDLAAVDEGARHGVGAHVQQVAFA